MDIKCPHCGTEYEVGEKDFGRYTQCEICGKGFVIGVSANGRPSGSSDGKTGTLEQTVNSRRFVPHHTQRTSSSNGKPSLPDRLARPGNCNPSSASVKHRSPSVPAGKSAYGKIIAIIAGVFALCLVLCAICYCGYLYFGDAPRLNRGVESYAEGAFSKAYRQLLPLAQKGNAIAQLHVGDCYSQGLGVLVNKEEAVKWYRLAADQGNAEAQFRMFQWCSVGSGEECNIQNAVKWCRKAADAGFEEAMYAMGMLYVEGIGVENNAKSAVKWFRRGAESGHVMSLYKFGQCYKLGVGVEKDEDEAAKWQNKAVSAWRQMADQGNPDAMVRLAELYHAGEVVELDKEESVKWYRKAAELGDENAQFNLASCYFKGDGIEEDREEAAKWMMKSSENSSDSLILWTMGCYYMEGWGVEKNPQEAVKWFERAAKKGFAPAQYSLAMCYIKGEGVKLDAEFGESLLQSASDAGNKDAKTELTRIRYERDQRQIREAKEKAEKEEKVEYLTLLETSVSNAKKEINDILAGTRTGNWKGFDASKISATDPTVSVKEEHYGKLLSNDISNEDSLAVINNAIANAEHEFERLNARLSEIKRVKSLYDVKELESRKEICVPCNGTGAVDCARCKGKGEIVVKEKEPCPICSRDYPNYNGLFTGEGFDPTDAAIRGKGQVRKEVNCSNCFGRGEVRTKCRNCNGSGKISVREPGRIRSVVSCPDCGGSGKGEPRECRKCYGQGRTYVLQDCPKCRGRGEISSGSNVQCPVCAGKCRLTCERCKGKGFVYRPKSEQ